MEAHSKKSERMWVDKHIMNEGDVVEFCHLFSHPEISSTLALYLRTQRLGMDWTPLMWIRAILNR